MAPKVGKKVSDGTAILAPSSRTEVETDRMKNSNAGRWFINLLAAFNLG